MFTSSSSLLFFPKTCAAFSALRTTARTLYPRCKQAPALVSRRWSHCCHERDRNVVQRAKRGGCRARLQELGCQDLSHATGGTHNRNQVAVSLQRRSMTRRG